MDRHQQLTQEKIDRFYSQMKLTAPDQRAHFNRMAPQPDAAEFRVVISSTSDPF